MVRNTFWTECDSLIVQSPQDPQQATSPQGMAAAVEQWQWALWKPSKKGSGTSTSSCCPSGVLPAWRATGPSEHVASDGHTVQRRTGPAKPAGSG